MKAKVKPVKITRRTNNRMRGIAPPPNVIRPLARVGHLVIDFRRNEYDQWVYYVTHAPTGAYVGRALTRKQAMSMALAANRFTRYLRGRNALALRQQMPSRVYWGICRTVNKFGF